MKKELIGIDYCGKIEQAYIDFQAQSTSMTNQGNKTNQMPQWFS